MVAPTTTPLNRDGEIWEEAWMARHRLLNERLDEGPIDLIFVGDSITHYWEPSELWERDGAAVWEDFYGGRSALNFGIAGDGTSQVLWRLENSDLEAISPKVAVVMIGTNNLSSHTAEEIAEGMVAVVDSLRRRLPRTRVLLLATFPRGELPDDPDRLKLQKASSLASAVSDRRCVHYLDINESFLREDGTIDREKLPDLVHLSETGYLAWAEAIESELIELLGRPCRPGEESH